jgi:glycosyltransferase involved in cell wall biosynthesis
VPFGSKFRHTLGNLVVFRKSPADIYHITGHIHYLALLFSPENTVLTIHDLRFLNAKGRLRRWLLKKLYLDIPVRRLKYITAISKHTKDEIIANMACDPAKIRILDVPAFDHLDSTKRKEFDKYEPVLLQVGTMPNKNLENLVMAISGLRCKLKIIGKLSKGQLDLLERSDVRFENAADLSADQMLAEYRKSDVVTFCSTYEGFGLPIIEAQAVGVPVITSDISPMSETSGGAACLVDPNNVRSIRNGVRKILDDDRYRNELIDAGFANAKRFAPSRVALQYESLYKEIADSAIQ